MTPLIKSMIRKTSTVSFLSKDRLRAISKGITDIISGNRRFMTARLGSRVGWRGVDKLSQCHAPYKVNLEIISLMDLNDYFAKLCSDNMHIEPTPWSGISLPHSK